jgi:hypothetical protein
MGAIFLTLVVVAIVFATEIGRIGIIQSEMQRTADAGALAACWELASNFGKDVDTTDAIEAAREAAKDYVSRNVVRKIYPVLDNNAANSSSGDIVVGAFNSFGNPAAQIAPSTSSVNAVKVVVHMDDVRNGARELGLAKLLGFSTFANQATATAAWIPAVRGFKKPSEDQQPLGILPFAIKVSDWDAMIAGAGADQWKWNPATKSISPGSDGILELNMYPGVTGSPGNVGTVDVGSNNNSSQDIKRQILYGMNASDLEKMGGKIELNSDGKLYLNGDTGISAGFKEQLNAVKGQPRVIFLYQSVAGNGNNAYYTIVRFVGIRILDVKLTGNPKKVTIQPAVVVLSPVIPSTETNTSYKVFSPVVLVN